MKKMVAVILALALAASVAGCGAGKTPHGDFDYISSEPDNSSTVDSSEQYFGDYRFANDSTAKLGEKIYIGGTIKKALIDSGNIYGIVEVPNTKREWAVLLCKSADAKRNIFEDVVGQQINVFGVSIEPYSSDKIPAMSTERITVGNADYSLNDFIKAGNNGDFLTDENKYENTDIKSGGLYDQVTKIYPNIKVSQIYDKKVGTKDAQFEVTTDEKDLLANARKFVNVMDTVRKKCAPALSKLDYQSLQFTHKIKDRDKDNYLLFVFDKHGDRYTVSDDSQVEVTASLDPDYAKAFSVALEDMKDADLE